MSDASSFAKFRGNTMKPTPADWPRISASIFYDDASAAIDWLCRAFGFEVRLKVEGEGGRIEHSELVFGEGLIMVGGSGGEKPEHGKMVSPRSTGGQNTQILCVYVDDVDAHCARARAAGAKIFREPATSDYGEEYASDRSYGATDPEGHQWFFMRRVRDAKRDAK
jgi:uncharacterized glyoxalase superfamily protein PhnB